MLVRLGRDRKRRMISGGTLKVETSSAGIIFLTCDKNFIDNSCLVGQYFKTIDSKCQYLLQAINNHVPVVIIIISLPFKCK